MKKYCLGDLIEIKHGYAFDGQYIQEIDNGIDLLCCQSLMTGEAYFLLVDTFRDW